MPADGIADVGRDVNFCRDSRLWPMGLIRTSGGLKRPRPHSKLDVVSLFPGWRQAGPCNESPDPSRSHPVASADGETPPHKILSMASTSNPIPAAVTPD